MISNDNVDNVRFGKENSYPTVGEHLTAKHFVEKPLPISEYKSSLLRLEPIEKLEPDEQDF